MQVVTVRMNEELVRRLEGLAKLRGDYAQCLDQGDPGGGVRSSFFRARSGSCPGPTPREEAWQRDRLVEDREGTPTDRALLPYC